MPRMSGEVTSGTSADGRERNALNGLVGTKARVDCACPYRQHTLSEFQLPWSVLFCKYEERDFIIAYYNNYLILLLVIVDNLLLCLI